MGDVPQRGDEWDAAQSIEPAPRDGTWIRVHRIGHRRGGIAGILTRWATPERARWIEHPDGFKGWFNAKGEYLSPVPDVWLPVESNSVRH